MAGQGSSLPRFAGCGKKKITMYFVYILKSKKDNGFYIGCTSNLQKRIEMHNSGKTQSLKHRRPLEIIYIEEYTDSSRAYQREKEIKSFKGGRAFQSLINGGVA